MFGSRRASALLALGLLTASAGWRCSALAAVPSQPASTTKAKPKMAAGTKVAVLEVTGMT
jgi:hypothetical protein